MKRLNLIAIAAVAVLMLAGCKGKEKATEFIPGIGPGDTQSVVGENRASSNGSIVGTWEGSEELDLAEVQGKTRIIYTFNDDGTLEFERYASGKAPIDNDDIGAMTIGTKFRYAMNGTWDVLGDAVVIEFDVRGMEVELKEVTVLESSLSPGMKALVEEELQKPENLKPMEDELTKELKKGQAETEKLVNIGLQGNTLTCTREGTPFELTLTRK